MRKRPESLAGALLGLVVALSSSVSAAAPAAGASALKSAGPLAFGPDGVLFVGDTAGAALFAIETGDKAPATPKSPINLAAIDRKIADAVGVGPEAILINDLAINPASGAAWISASRGKGPDAKPLIVRVDPSGKVEPLDLDATKAVSTPLPDAPAAGTGPRNPRADVVTDLAYVDGRVFVAGLSNEEFSSRLLAVPYPFGDATKGTSIEIYHGAHGKFETKSPVRTFAAYQISGQPYLMAAYTCTPLVKLPVSELKPGSHYKGTTVAELGNRNKPLDMVVYSKGGKDYILLANSSRGVMKIRAEGIAEAPSISAPVRNTEGQPYETLANLKGVVQLDALDTEHAVLLVQGADGAMNLETIDLP